MKEANEQYDKDWEKTINSLKGKTDWYQEQLKSDCKGRHIYRLNSIIKKLEKELSKLKNMKC